MLKYIYRIEQLLSDVTFCSVLFICHNGYCHSSLQWPGIQLCEHPPSKAESTIPKHHVTAYVICTILLCGQRNACNDQFICCNLRQLRHIVFSFGGQGFRRNLFCADGICHIGSSHTRPRRRPMLIERNIYTVYVLIKKIFSFNHNYSDASERRLQT